MVGHGGSSAGSYVADPTSPSPPTVHQLSRLALEGLIDIHVFPRTTCIHMHVYMDYNNLATILMIEEEFPHETDL